MTEHDPPVEPLPGDPFDPTTAADAVELALDAYAALAALAETIEDEWTYVVALAEVGRRRIAGAHPVPGPTAPAGTGAAPASPLPSDRGRAVRLAAAEIRAITDPHRAIDWLSTFPAVVELALAPAARG